MLFRSTFYHPYPDQLLQIYFTISIIQKHKNLLFQSTNSYPSNTAHLYKKTNPSTDFVPIILDRWKENIAFANTDGGKVYIGVDDGGKVIGLKRPKQDLESISNTIRDSIRPDISMHTSVYIKEVENKEIKLCNGYSKN